MSSQEILTEHTESSLKFDSFKPMAISTRKNSINSNSPKRKLLSSTSMELGSSPCRDKKRQKRTIPVSGLEYVLHSMGIDTETIGALQCKPLQDFKKQIHKPINESMNLNLPLYSFDEAGFDQVCEFVLDQYKAEVSQITVEMDQLEKDKKKWINYGLRDDFVSLDVLQESSLNKIDKSHEDLENVHGKYGKMKQNINTAISQIDQFISTN